MSKNHLSSDEVHHTGCRKLVSSLLCWSLVLNNVLLVPLVQAAHSIVPSDESKTRVYDLEENEEVTVIDIAKPVDGVSINVFSSFQDSGSRKILLNNSQAKTRSVLTTQKINSNPNLDFKEADSIEFYLISSGSNNASLLTSSFEVLGDKKVDLFVLSNPDGMILRGGRYLNIAKLRLVSDMFVSDNLTRIAGTTGGEIDLLPSYSDYHLAIDASGVDELEILARKINLEGEILAKGSVNIHIDKYSGLACGKSQKKNSERATKMADELKVDEGNLFRTSSFGFVRVGNLRLEMAGKDNFAKIGTNIISFFGDSVIDLQGGMILEGEKAKFLVEQGSLTLTARTLILGQGATLFSQDLMLLKLGDTLLNDGKSLISTGIGDLIIETTGALRNIGASTIKSGGNLLVNGLRLENIGIGIDSFGTPLNGVVAAAEILKSKRGDCSTDSFSDINRVKDIAAATPNTFVSKPFFEYNEDGFPCSYHVCTIIAELENTKGKNHRKRFEVTGHIPWKNTVNHGQDRVDVLEETDPSKILAEGNMFLEIRGDIDNSGSEIRAGNILRISGKVVRNERQSFNLDLKYAIYSQWRRDRVFSHNVQKYEVKDYNSTEAFYSRTPSLMMGKRLGIVADEIYLDSKKINRDQEPNKSSSRLEAEGLLYLRAKKVVNRGLVISIEEELDVLVENYLDNRGGSFLSKMGGTVESLGELNEEPLVKIFRAENNIFSDPIQLSAIGVVDTEEYLLGNGKDPEKCKEDRVVQKPEIYGDNQIEAKSPEAEKPRTMTVKAKKFIGNGVGNRIRIESPEAREPGLATIDSRAREETPGAEGQLTTLEIPRLALGGVPVLTKKTKEARVMTVKAKKIKGKGGSFFAEGDSTIKIIAEELDAGPYAVTNKIEGGSRGDQHSLAEDTQNLKTVIRGGKIEIEVDEFKADGAELDGTYGIDVKVKKKFVANDVYNTNLIEQETSSDGLLHSERDHKLLDTSTVLRAKFSSAQGSVNIEGEEGIHIKNVDFNAQGDVNLVSEGGDVILESTGDTYRAEHSHSESNFGGLTAGADSGGLSVGFKKSIEVEEARSSGSKVAKSTVNAGGKFSVKAKNSLIQGVDVNADEMELDVEKNVQLLAALEHSKEEYSKQELTTTTSYRIGNSYVDTASAAVSAVENQARALEAINSVAEMQELYEKGRASKKALVNAKENLALALANAGMSVTQLAKQAALSAGTTLVGGFYMTLDIQTLGTEISAIQEKMGFVQNTINTRKITIKSGGNAHIEAQIDTTEELSINVAGDLELESLQ
ncbi:MAG: hemagglutinin repeat-containing protein, partial [Rickettsiales bacterium]|nr:hemagglutinin repeat-containing protein [Rickettsiales bacterium]